MFFVYEDDRQIGRGKYRELDPTDIVVGYIGTFPIYQKMMDQISKRIKGIEISFDELVSKEGKVD